MSKIVPVLLAGGRGTRLWPLSRKSYPKQFSKLLGKKSLFQETVNRFTSSELVRFSSPIIMTNAEFRFIVAEQLQDIDTEPKAILIEPTTKNTSPAILAAALYSYEKDPESILLVSPSDHAIPNEKAFHEAIYRGYQEIKNNKIVIFGVKPTRPETGYGYIECAEVPAEKAVRVERFFEKPNIETAEVFAKANHFLWNAGIFLFKAENILREFRSHAPDMIAPISHAVSNATIDLGFLRLDPNAWEKTRDISIDYAIMEYAQDLIAIPYTGEWSDLGGWNSVWQEHRQDRNGVVLSDNATAIDCNNSLIRSENNNQHIVGLGLDNMIVVGMPDAVLVADKSRSEEVRDVVSKLKNAGVNQAETFPTDHRPWGRFETLLAKDFFKVKYIVVKPGASLSLQSHKCRSEHWVVVAGTAITTLNGSVNTLNRGESIYVPVGAIHKLENREELPLELIEIQTGSYLGEDDIVRYEDPYQRLENE